MSETEGRPVESAVLESTVVDGAAELPPVTAGAGDLRGSLRRVQWVGRQDGEDAAEDGTDTLRPQLAHEARVRSRAVLIGVVVMVCIMAWALASSHSG